MATALCLPTGLARAADFRSGLSAYNIGDYVRAFRDWMAMAEQGEPRSQASLGYMYFRGIGVVQDDKEAAYWFQRAADQGQPEAQRFLGTMHLEGRAVRQSDVLALMWCELALINGHGGAGGCRGTALSRMSGTDAREGFRLANQWVTEHPDAYRAR